MEQVELKKNEVDFRSMSRLTVRSCFLVHQNSTARIEEENFYLKVTTNVENLRLRPEARNQVSCFAETRHLKSR